MKDNFLENLVRFTNQYHAVVRETAESLKIEGFEPKWAITLGSGLGKIVNEMEILRITPYSNINFWPESTVEGHEGNLVMGTIEGVPVIGLQGRKHFYEEGNDLAWNLKISFPMNVLAELGVENYFVTNAAGGLNTNFQLGDIMVIKDHINLIPNPLMGMPHDCMQVNGSPVPRFVNMKDCYDKELTQLLLDSTADKENIRQGVYLATTGPTYETSAESKAFRSLGADAVGMSTAPEVITARWRGLRCVGMSCITNTIDSAGNNTATHEEVVGVLDNPTTYHKLAETTKTFFRKL